MPNLQQIKTEPLCDDQKAIEATDCIENNIEAEFLLIFQMKVEIEIESENQKRTQNEKFQCQKCPKSFKKRVSLYVHKQVHEPKLKCQMRKDSIRLENSQKFPFFHFWFLTTDVKT
jgi:hypothetical protein